MRLSESAGLLTRKCKYNDIEPAPKQHRRNVELDQACEIAGSAVRNYHACGEHRAEPGVRLPLVLHREVFQPLATLAKPY